MENKKAMQINSPHEDSEAILKHVHQHNPQQMRLLQYGLKLNQPHQHQPQQQLNAPNVYSHVHQHPPQPSYHKHPLPAPEHKYQPNIYTNQLHQHVQPNSRPKTETVQYQTHYQSNENAYNPLKQQNPQIWVPHQPPAHYHQQQQVKIENQQKQQSPNQSGAPQIKPKTVERKKSSSGNQQLRSPVAKRPSHAPVEMQGWLYKQGSEGLMLWKKRWFVLSEYCLFYYKGPEEDKLLGSILLPSYKVSVCGSEAKFNKKYAFKLEHANMRTYILAADSQELMAQWILNLNAACLLQSHSEPVIAQPVSSSNSNQNESNYQHNQRHTFATTPVHMHSSSNATDLSSPSQQELSQYSQPLYANAPPKPRRLNDGSYSSPSPEISERYVSDLRYSHLNAMKRSPVPMYGGPEYVARMPHIQSREYDMTPVRDVYGLLPNTERRTPDTYGRSSLNAPKSRYPGDYEDVYAEQAMYKRPISPLGYSNVKKTNPSMQHTYTPVSMMPQREMYPQQAVQMRRPPNVTIPRPHSADFLEYEFSRRTDPSSVPVQQARPKSSLDINRNTLNDNYFYSEKQYAANMRKSVQYLPKQHMPKRPIQNKCLGNLENTFPLMRSNTQPLHLDNVGNDSSKHCIQPVRSRSVLSEGSLTKELDVRGSPYESYGQESSSPVVTSHREQYYMQEGRRREYDQFTRSASARLPYANQHEQIHDGRSTARDGEKKREESMKRLLEWKQRMLQSPLNRKVNQSNMRGRNEYYYRNVDNGYQIKTPGDPYTDTQKATNTFPQYNSYSSDDEENEDRSKEKEQTQAGWTVDSYQSTSEPQTSTSTTVYTEEQSCSENTNFAKPLKMFNKEPSSVAQVSTLRSEYNEKFEKTPVIKEIKSNDALVKSILSDFEKISVSEPEQKESSSFTDKPKEDIEENYVSMTSKRSFSEMHSVFGKGSPHLEIEEDPYMEMIHGANSTVLSSGCDPQEYEIVCFGKSKNEPLYMELTMQKSEQHAQSKPELLPDIVSAPQEQSDTKGNKSDSSDADDEASKDLDSLDTPSQPRFSLSDSFRPASYYLGATQATPEFQDSSDSELVSPPPIPTSSPPMTEYDNNDESITSSLSFSEQPRKSSKDGKQDSYYTEKDHDTSSVCTFNTDTENKEVDEYGKRERGTKSQSHQDFHDYENLYVFEDSGKKICASPLQILHSRESSKEATTSGLSYEEFVPRAQVDANSSATAEITALLPTSACSTPTVVLEPSFNAQELSSVSFYFRQQKDDNSFTQPAPYYYSDLSMNTSHSNSSTILMLNNQRESMNGNKRDITHIVNPIRCNTHVQNLHSPYGVTENTFKLAAEARSVSVDFLNLADKSGQIDKKNIYESDTLKRLKAVDSVSSLQSNPETRNLYPYRNKEKFNRSEAQSEDINFRRSHSLEGLLENVLSEAVETSPNQTNGNNETNTDEFGNDNTEGSYLWEEDAVWRERLRSASQRHTRSLDDLDCVCEPKKSQKKHTRGISRLVTYVNDNIYNMPQKELEKNSVCSNCKNTAKNRDSTFIIDREKLRQWDLMSSAPADGQRTTNTVVGCDQQGEQEKVEEPASGSVSLNIRDTFPRAISAKRVWTPTPQMGHSRSALSIPKVHESDYNLSRQSAGQYGASQHDIQLENIRKANWKWNEKMNMSAGELLGRTHEELVLLLIQLRRQSTNICHAIEACYNEIDNIQAQLHLMDQVKKLENLQKLDQIKQHLIELEKQYEKGKPLVNLVDNMVKLGSLYRSPSDRLNPYVRDRIEFNQQIQERRLLAEERRDWNRLNPNHAHLQEKVQELYQLDRLIQEESSTLQNLQQDKEDIERALGDLRQRINKGFSDPAEIDQARKQQMMLEKELTRVHSKLAENSKKLEETVAGNARLEQKLLVLKQKLQLSRQQRSSPQFSNPGDSLPCFVGTSAMLESDLQRVQQKVGDLQRQRKELSMQVRQLTDRSNNLQQQIKPLNGSSQNREGNKKKTPSSWRETDLDTMSSVDHGETWENPLNSPRTTPLYINTDLRHNPDCDPYGRSMRSSDSASDDTTQNSSCHQEKQEIKTVRIVKRESERRQREREKLPAGKWESLIEEDDSSQSSSILFCPTVVQKTQSSSNLLSTSSEGSKNSSSILSRQNSVSSPSIQAYSEDSLDKSELSPVFKSEAARQIITEVSVQEKPKQLNRRAVPKEKRRHYTAPHNNLIMKSLNQLPTDDSVFDKSLLDSKRARDDLDMERALRQRIDAPDVVRSTLSNKELKYNENTIDSILGTPNKINIPERYIPEQLPQLSAEEQEHRLRKVESIKKMLSDTIISSNTVNLNAGDGTSDKTLNSLTNKATSKMIEEKKQREHLLQLNQILAKQVMEMSKIVAVKALAALPLQEQQPTTEEEDLSPITPLPLYQQRDNFYS